MTDDPSPRRTPPAPEPPAESPAANASAETALSLHNGFAADQADSPATAPNGANGGAGGHGNGGSAAAANGHANGNGHTPPRSARRSVWRDIWRLLRRQRGGESSLRDALEELAERHEEDSEPIDPTEHLILENTLRLRGQTVEDVMVPRADIAAIEVNMPLLDVVQRIGETHHSRMPVFEGDLDHTIGLIHVKDVLPAVAGDGASVPLRTLLRPAMIVAPSMRVLDLLLRMRLERTHMALVVDEFGGIDGLVTIEDLVEQIVGEIEDEHDVAEETTLERRPDGTLIADARVFLEDFEAEVGEVLSNEERDHVDTLGGLVFNLVGRVPGRGEIVIHPSGIEFEILEGDPRRLKRLRVRNLPPPPEPPQAATMA
ncbi:MAG: HlyC/CorC family transporter [Alphaproteobacteria bacterium]|nr:HlyC/CorC family transporter [Alphaproteobacteria bacterium]MCB9931101.1 HlyC/CorC family transporter [Alphaproteobacteria bacterium]